MSIQNRGEKKITHFNSLTQPNWLSPKNHMLLHGKNMERGKGHPLPKKHKAYTQQIEQKGASAMVSHASLHLLC